MSRLRFWTRWPRARWGNLARCEPLDADYGYGRGTPVDRVYIEDFLRRHEAHVTGRVLEVKDAAYTRRYGSDRVTRVDVLDRPGADNPGATIRADLGVAGSLSTAAFDCVILTQTLQFVAAPLPALANIWRSLAPGGTLLLTVPTVSIVAPEIHDRWRWTPAALALDLRRSLPDAEATVEGYGNLTASIAFLHGMAAEEVPGDLMHRDVRYPVLATAAVRKPT